jgi:hypothetical protein
MELLCGGLGSLDKSIIQLKKGSLPPTYQNTDDTTYFNQCSIITSLIIKTFNKRESQLAAKLTHLGDAHYILDIEVAFKTLGARSFRGRTLTYASARYIHSTLHR